HKNILYVTWDKDLDLSIEKHKIKGYSDAMANIGKKPLIFGIDGYKIDDGYKKGGEILEFIRENDVTAVFCCQDEIAIGLINYLYDNNIKVPDEISVVGYGDISLASIYRPKLTTIKEPYYDLGAVAIRRILKEVKGESVDERSLKLPIQLVVRDSAKDIK
uniref:LacI family DNA-binding transcriptional regulator n=1 Tax=Alkalibaculum bacchi TaxID=645887 RepID=UPI0026EC510D